MFYGRDRELGELNKLYNSDKTSVVLMYGRKGIGKTNLIRKFIRDKRSIYFNSYPVADSEQERLLRENIFDKLSKNSDIKVVVIENFSYFSRVSQFFFDSVEELSDSGRKILYIITSSLEYWVENTSTLYEGSSFITSVMKLKEITFADTVKSFEGYSVDDCLKVYAVTGGIPGYMQYFDDSISFKDNIIKLFLVKNAPLRDAGIDIVSLELRETGIYNSILYYLATDRNKLNDLYSSLGYGRDKISVYLKNLIDRNIVEKVYSFETQGTRNTKKGVYRIKCPLVEFWYRCIFSNASALELMEGLHFYNEFIKNSIGSLALGALIKLAGEYVDYLDNYEVLPARLVSKGSWYGKEGTIHIIAKDSSERYLVCQCFYAQRSMSYDDFTCLKKYEKQALVEPEYHFLFSLSGFDMRLMKAAKEDKSITLVNVNEM